MPTVRRSLAVAFAVVTVVSVLAPAAVAPAAASTPPSSVCPVCGPTFEYAADEAGVDVTATHSTVHVHVDEAGDARFFARVELNRSDARDLRENERAFDALVTAAFEDNYNVVGIERAREVDAELRDDDLVASWTVPDAARRGPGGTLLVTLFGERDTGLVLHADQLALTGPDGWNVTNHPKTGDVQSLAVFSGDRSGDRVVWKGDAEYDSREDLDAGTYVAFAETDGLLARANAELAVASTIGPEMLSDAVVAGGPSSLLLAGALVVCLFVLGASPNPGRDARWLAVVGALVTVGGFAYAVVDGYGPLLDRNLQLLALPAGIAAFGWLTARAPTVANLREAALRVGATVGVGGLIAVALSDSFLSFIVATIAVTVGGFYLVGVYDQRVGWPVAAVTALVVATPVLGVLPSTPIGGFGPGFVGFLLTPMTLLAAVVGITAYRVGAGKQVTGERVVDERTTA